MTITIGNKRHGARGHYVGRPSPLGNPFVIGTHGTRKAVIDQYAGYLDTMLQWDSPARRELDYLIEQARQGDLTLVCHCHPADCHARLIKERIERELEVQS